MKSKGRVAVGLSGGVDSSVAAALLKEEGYSVLGLTMQIWNGKITLPAGAKEACFGPDEAEDIEACASLCEQLDIEYRVIDLCTEYESRVLDYFRREYLAGRTPNPCIVCNSELKFGFLLEKAQELGLEFEYFATGHYARVARDRDGAARLRAGLDGAKDQSYFLYRLGPKRLSKLLFPLGELTKAEVRERARRFRLEVAEKPESQDFIAGGDYAALFEGRKVETGEIVDFDGHVLGKHRGLPYYTIGQRRGLGLGAAISGDSGEPEPLYVLALDPQRNRVIVGPNRGLFAEGLLASDFICYSQTEVGPAPSRGLAKIRQNHRPAPCTYALGEDRSCRVHFDESQRALAPGQALVIYDSDGYVLGGGTIEASLSSLALEAPFEAPRG
jgi:tRNA-specific 2-thiouridylase